MEHHVYTELRQNLCGRTSTRLHRSEIYPADRQTKAAYSSIGLVERSLFIGRLFPNNDKRVGIPRGRRIVASSQRSFAIDEGATACQVPVRARG